MDKMNEFLERTLVSLANKMGQNKYLSSISTGFSYLLPVVMTGALFTLVSSLNFQPYQTFITKTGIKTLFSFASTVTTNMLAVYTVFLIAKAFGEKEGYSKESLFIATTALVSFMLMIPLKSVKINGVVSVFLPTRFLGAAGLFSAMIIALTSAKIYLFILEKDITIKLPDSVPPTISKSFSAIIPSLIIIFVFSLIRLGFSFTSYGDLNSLIYSVIQTPLVKLGRSPLTFVFCTALCSLLWFFGIHGGMIVMPILNTLYMPTLLENLAAYQSGKALPNLITQSTWMNFASLGGAGGTLGLCILMLFLAKSERYKSLGKLAIVPGICGINEPITFGFPMVLNTMMLIPMILTPIITFGISFLCMSTGLVPFPNVVANALGTPVGFSALMTVGWQGAILQLILVVVQMVVYYPFFKAADNNALKDEKMIEKEKV